VQFTTCRVLGEFSRLPVEFNIFFTGAPGLLFIMGKRDAGYDSGNDDCKCAMAVNGKVARIGNGMSKSPVQFCSACR